MELTPESFEKFETPESVASRDDEYWEPTWVNGYFHGSLSCPRTPCGNKYSIAGRWKVERYTDPEIDDLDDVYGDYLSVTYILPAFPLMEYPVGVPDQVREAVTGASQVLLSDASAAANRIRSAIEVLLDSKRVPVFVPGSRSKRLTTHGRIEQFMKKNPAAAKHLMATKVIGNYGSHEREILPLSVVLDGMEHFARALELLYDRDEAALERRAEVISRQGRRLRVKKLSHLSMHRVEYNIHMISAVVFDVGETLVNESREYGTWADWLGVPRHTFSAVFGAVIALGMDYRDTFQFFRPDFSLEHERAERASFGQPETFDEDDLYPDARECMTALRDMGIWVGVAGNQTSRAGEILRKLDLPADLIATSEDWGASKPDAAFFDAVISAAPCEASRIIYVGDRLDNDLKPAKNAGMRTAFIRRGPWGYILQQHADMAQAADWRIISLAELPPLVDHINRSERSL